MSVSYPATISSDGGDVTVTGTGGTVASGSSQGSTYGVYLNGSITSGGGGSIITAGGSGNVNVTGYGGQRLATSGDINFGVYVNNGRSPNFSTITSSGGNVTVTGTGGGGSGASASTAQSNHGVKLSDGGSITSGANGTVTVTGNGGNNSTGGTGPGNYGVLISGGTSPYFSKITSNNGAVTVTGNGGGSGGSGMANNGVGVSGAGQITSAGAATAVTVNGTGGSSSGSQNHGIIVLGANSIITSGGGNVAINGTEGLSATSLALYMTAAGAISTATNGGNITITGNSFNSEAGTSIAAPTSGVVNIIPKTIGTTVGFVSTADAKGSIFINTAEMATITGGTINIGNSSTKAISISDAVTVPVGSNLNLATASSSAGINSKVDGTEITMGAGKTLGLSGIPSLNIAIEGATVNTQYDQFKVVGDVTLGMALSVSGAYMPTGGEVFTIVDATSITGTFSGLANGATVIFNGTNLIINYTSTTVTLTAPSCTNPTAGGTIAASQSGASGFDPAAFTSMVSASGETGTLEYKWQSSTSSNSVGFSDIASSNAATYDAGALTVTTWFKRLARVACSADWAGAAESNVLQVTVSLPVSLTASSGTTTGSYNTLKGAFDAINAGTHRGVIEIKINANTTESATASLNASAVGSSVYTSINIYPTTTGLSITGNLAAPLINLNGADNVTIDGRVNATGSTKDLTITNTSALATAGTSTIRFIGDASNNTVQYCNLKGSSTDAAAGIVFFSTAGTGNGNDNNTITNNDITCAADASRPLNAVFALGTTLKNNETNTISNNNIYNFLSKATASQGINISSYNSGYTISGNSFYETASFTASAAVNYNVILISAATGTGNGFKVSGNYIGGNTALCAGTAWTKTALNNAFTAISVTTATGTANNIHSNTIQNFNWANAGAAAFTGISLAGATIANIGTVTGNTIGATTGTGSITYTSSSTTGANFYGIYITSTDGVDCQNNTIGSITVANAFTNANTNFTGIFKASFGTTTISNNTIGSTTTASSINASSASSGSSIQSVRGIQSAGSGVINISGNTIANMVNATTNGTTTSAGSISGIYSTGGTNTIANNVVRDLTIANANTSITSTASVSGIVMASSLAVVNTVSGNTIYNLSNSNFSFAGGVIGIYYSGSTTASVVKANFIHSLSVTAVTSTTADLYGIKIDAGAATYSNNIISLGGNTKTDLFGIFQTDAAVNNNNNLFYNTVYIAGSLVSGATNTSYALYSTTVIPNTRDFRNNIFVNARSTESGASKHYAMYIAASGGTITCNYNNYFVSGTGGVLGYFGADKTALPIVTNNDANSIITNPAFSNAGGTTASDYIPTTAGVAVNTTGITVDYAGNTRATNVTMGAYELKGAPDAPTALVATAGSNLISVAFTAPVNVGGGAVTNYAYSLDNGATWVTRSPANTSSPLTIENLNPCTNYSIILRAMNSVGVSVASAAVTATPLNGPQAGAWVSATPVANVYWGSITYGNGLFVAVSVSGGVMISSNGITWTGVPNIPIYPWNSITYGNGVFVAVGFGNQGMGNQVMTSTDGISWTLQTSPGPAGFNVWGYVTYGNGLFVAFSQMDNKVMTSTDGVNWTGGTEPLNSESLISATYGNGVFVKIYRDYSNGGSLFVKRSTDAVTWTISTPATSNLWRAVTYGNGLFVAVSEDGTGNRVMTSPDGITWTSRTSAADNAWWAVTYGNGLFVALAQTGTGNRIMTSPDGINWTLKTSVADNFWSAIAYGNGRFAAVSTDLVMTASVVFAPSSPSITTITPSVTTAAVAFTAPANSGFGAITNYEYSTDNGSTWVTPSPAVTTSPLTIAGLTSGNT